MRQTAAQGSMNKGFVIPAQAGIQSGTGLLDSGLRRNDGN